MKLLLTFFLSAMLIAFTSCDSNIEEEHRTEEQSDSIADVMDQHQEEIEDIASSLELKMERLESKLNTDNNEE